MIEDILHIIRCPSTGSDLVLDGDTLRNSAGERFPIVDGIPFLIQSERLQPTHSGWSDLIKENLDHATNLPVIDDGHIEKFLEGMLVPTCGNLYKNIKKGRIPEPIFPDFDKPEGPMIEIGCNWGRWVLAAARKGIQVVGVDIHLDSLRIAQHLAKRLQLNPMPIFILADARALPFKDGALASAFSYSVIQHFSKEHACDILAEIGRILKPGGASFIQMPNRNAIRSQVVLKRRGGNEGENFDVRYYAIDELVNLFESTIGLTKFSVDCFFGLNVRPEDRDIVDLKSRAIISLSETVRKISQHLTRLQNYADSVFLHSKKAP